METVFFALTDAFYMQAIVREKVYSLNQEIIGFSGHRPGAC